MEGQRLAQLMLSFMTNVHSNGSPLVAPSMQVYHPAFPLVQYGEHCLIVGETVQLV